MKVSFWKKVCEEEDTLVDKRSKTLGEASSTRAATIQPIHRPSIGSKNQGEVNEHSEDLKENWLMHTFRHSRTLFDFELFANLYVC
ncbi:hypothetical protein K7X08_016853 [Anisodus acutangulus]|uniref:Uncharacterized protein n=1 Tax=Anisodus acutangulus TaxID=402998 RepID=A0A9Q1R6M0_9SOLA|nr:hypothetical protein K7X08_016853 [Anisodus acutangulus]